MTLEISLFKIKNDIQNTSTKKRQYLSNKSLQYRLPVPRS